MAKMYYDGDANLDELRGKTVAILGYGSQGHAHALNLKDSGVKGVVGLLEGSRSRGKAEADGVTVMTPAQASKLADVIMFCTPDTGQAKLYREDVAPNLAKGTTASTSTSGRSTSRPAWT